MAVPGRLFAAVCFSAISFAQAPVVCPDKLTESQLVSLLEGKVPERRVIQIVNQCGVKFPWTSEAGSRLSHAGATPTVLAAIESKAGAPGSSSAKDPADDARLRADLALWESAKERKTVAAYEDYLQHFPQGAFASAAREALETLREAERTTAQEAEAREREARAKTATPPAEEIISSFQTRECPALCKHSGTLSLTASHLSFQPDDGPLLIWTKSDLASIKGCRFMLYASELCVTTQAGETHRFELMGSGAKQFFRRVREVLGPW